MKECCLKGFSWNGTPAGKEGTLANNKTYITGSNSEVAILIIADGFGWTMPNSRLIADHYAQEIGATVYMPDFFGGEPFPVEVAEDPSKMASFDLQGWIGRNSREIRWPEISSCAKALKSEHSFKRVGAMGYCYGGWGCFQLGSKDNLLVDAISMAHPSLVQKVEIENVGVPVQILAPEHDQVFTPELKEYCNKVIPTLGVEYDYQHFPGMNHGFASRGNPNSKAEEQALVRAKNAAVHWFKQYLHPQ